MVFNDSRTQNNHHNRLNLRDTSSDASNLYGDRNLPRPAPQVATNDRDLNDRQEDSSEDLLDEIPALEQHHVPHAERRQRAAIRKVKKQPSNLRQAGA